MHTNLIAAAPSNITAENLGTIELLMLGDAHVDSLFGNFRSISDFSLVSQLGVLGINPEQTPPDAVAFTVRSAIPIAAAIKGVYEVASKPCPCLLGVFTKTKPETDEVKRLRRIIDEGAKVVVIDQFVATGETISKAMELLRKADCDEVLPIAGRWYEEYDGAPELDAFRQRRLPKSPYSSVMRKIGRNCATRYLSQH